MRTILLLFSFLFFSVFYAGAQPSQNSRAELPLSSEYSSYEIYPQADSTVFLLIHETYVRRNADPFLLFKFGHDLRILWQKPLNLPRGCKFLKLVTENRSLFLLFEGSRRDELVLLLMNTQTGEQSLSTHQMPENSTFTLNEIKVLQGYLFLSGLQNERLTVLHLAPERPKIWKIPAVYDQPSALTAFQVDTVAKRVEFVLTESNGLKSRLQIKRFAPDGRLFSTSFLQSNDRNYLSGSLTSGDSTQIIIAGSYSLRDLRYAQGFFTGPLLTTGDQNLKYYDFTTFSHFFDHLRPGRQEKMHRKLNRFRLSKKTYFLRHRFLMHEMYATENGFILVGEQYYPQYEGGGASNRIFNGFGFTQVIAAAFDEQGNLQWENSFPLKNVQRFELEQVTVASQVRNGLIICYKHEDVVRYKLISGSESSSNEAVLQITPLVPGEKALNTDLDGIKPWYQNHFLAFGEQKIRSSNDTRSIYFLNKISF